MSPSLPLHLNLAEIPWEIAPSEGRYACDEKFVVAHVAQQRLDLSAVRLAPGKSSWPFHFHHANEELFFVLEGTGELRLGHERRRLRPMDIISCPPGPAGAHEIHNDGDQPLVYLVIGTVDPVDIIEYPDSGKVLIRNEQSDFEHIARLADRVPYLDGGPG